MSPLEQLEELKKETKEAIRVAGTATQHAGLLGEVDAYVVAEHAIRAAFNLGRREQARIDREAILTAYDSTSQIGRMLDKAYVGILASVAPDEGKE